MESTRPDRGELGLKAADDWTDILGGEVDLCDCLAGLLDRQREALLAGDPLVLEETTTQIGAHLDRLESAHRRWPSRGAIPPELQPSWRRVRRALEYVRMAGQINGEMLADLLAYLEFHRQRLSPGGLQGYNLHGEREVGREGGLQLDQEA